MCSEQRISPDEAFQKLQYVSESENMRRLYEEREKVIMDRLAELKAIREEGFAEGAAIGALETNTKIIRRMLNADFSMPMIYLGVPLPRPEIDAIIAGIRKESH